MKNMIFVFCVVALSMGANLHGVRRGYQRTINRAQMDRSRRMMRNYSRPRAVPRPALRYTSGPRPSLQEWTQEMVEPQGVMSTVEGP